MEFLQSITLMQYFFSACFTIVFFHQWKYRKILKKYESILDSRSVALDERTQALDTRTKSLDELSSLLDERTDLLNARTEQLNDYTEILNKRAALFVAAKTKLEAEYGIELEDEKPEEKTFLH